MADSYRVGGIKERGVREYVRARGEKSKTGLYTQMGQNSTSKANISQHYTSWDRLSIQKVNTYYMG